MLAETARCPSKAEVSEETLVEPQGGIRERESTVRHLCRGPSLSEWGAIFERLIHLVGDIHQPLHTLARFDRRIPTEIAETG
jgi:hypothetical protein